MQSIELFQHVLQQWEDRAVNGREHVYSFSREMKDLCSADTNLYVVDMQADDPFDFGTNTLLENVDMKGVSATFRDYPDHEYVEGDVLPFYLDIKATGKVSWLRMRSHIQGHFAVYDRLLLPMKEDDQNRWALSITKTRLLIPPTADLRVLTARQQDILSLMAEGMSSKECAQRLGISHRTIEHQLTAIRKKLNAKNMAHAIAMFVGRLAAGHADR